MQWDWQIFGILSTMVLVSGVHHLVPVCGGWMISLRYRFPREYGVRLFMTSPELETMTEDVIREETAGRSVTIDRIPSFPIIRDQLRGSLAQTDLI